MIRASAALSLAVLVGACGGGKDEGPKGVFHVSWSFQLMDGSSADCARAGVATVVAVADQDGDFESIPSPFDCTLYEADTQPLPLGVYTLKLEEYNPFGGFILSSPLLAGELVDEDAVVTIAPHVFDVRF